MQQHTAGDVVGVAAHLLAQSSQRITQSYGRTAQGLRRASAADPHNPAPRVQHAQACLENNDPTAALWAAWEVLKTDPTNEHAMRLYTFALIDQRRLDEALRMAWQTASQHPHCSLAAHVYAALLNEFGRNAEAIGVVNEALRRNPRSADLLVLRGDIATAGPVGYNPEAQYLEALRLNPCHALAMHNLAVTRMRWGTLTAAVGGLVTAARLDPTLGPSALGNIGLTLVRVLRLATASVVFMFVAVACVDLAHEDGLPTVIPRIAAAVLVAVLAYPVVWVLQTVPRPALKAALRQRWVLAVRIGFVSYAALVGLATALIGPNPEIAIAGYFLLPAFIGLRWLGWLSNG